MNETNAKIHPTSHEGIIQWYFQNFAADDFSKFPCTGEGETYRTEMSDLSGALTLTPQNISVACTENGIDESDLFQAGFAYLLSVYDRSGTAAYLTKDAADIDVTNELKAEPVCIQIDAKATIRDLLGSVHDQRQKTKEIGGLNAKDLKEKLGWDSDIIFVYGNMSGEASALVKEYPFVVNVCKSDDCYRINVCYPKDAVSEPNLLSMFEYYDHALKDIIDRSDVCEIELLSPLQKEEIIRKSAGKTLDIDNSKTVANKISAYASTTPDALAVDDDSVKLTYRELNHRADNLAHYLIDAGVKADDIVGVMLERSATFPVCALGIHKAGAAYLPLDLEYPLERLQFMMENSGVHVLITTKDILEEKNKEGSFKAETNLFMEDLDLDKDSDFVDLSKPEGSAYMIYTSGSTGTPKGAILHHAGLANLAAGLSEIFELTPKDRIASHRGFSFDGHTGDVYPTLTSGASLHIMPSGIRKDMDAIVKFLDAHNITGTGFATSIGVLLARRYELNLRYLSFGGEKLSGLISGKTRYINLYGPTECTNDVCTFKMETGKEYPDIPIGDPMPNLWGFIVDRFGHLLPPEIAGELCIAGIQVGKGYWKLPEKTNEVFGDCPFVEKDSFGRKVRMYHTGDLAKRDEEGHILCIGRIDSQVKLNGFRVELGEIESRAMEIDGVREAAAKVIKGSGGAHLALYYTLEADSDIDDTKMEESLKQTSLAAYMIPSMYVKMDDMPRTPSGKIDRKNLPAPQVKTVSEKIDPPTTFKENILWGILKDILGTENFGINTNLMDLGLTSIDALILVGKAEDQGVKIKVTDVTKYQTIIGILKHSSRLVYWVGDNYDPQKPIMVLPYGISPLPPMEALVSELCKSLNVLAVEPIVDHFYYILQGESIQDAMDLYMDLISMMIPEGKEIFGFMGHSYGGELAYKMAVQWSKKYGVKPHIYVMDSNVHDHHRDGYEAYSAGIREMFKDNPSMLQFYERGKVVIDVPRKLGDGVPFPPYDGPVVYFCATQLKAPLDYFSDNIVAVKRDDHPNAIAWRELNPHVEMVFVETSHRKLPEPEFVPIYMKYITRDINNEK
ncbi:MAG: amino acid adenylation domain-containing protein [Lachnospiraceae bacterium]|nr:amino acid adenylation domain-containing protein [Lachnospiraceae bacterium]